LLEGLVFGARIASDRQQSPEVSPALDASEKFLVEPGNQIGSSASMSEALALCDLKSRSMKPLQLLIN
jgi:hypothetical protein